MKIVLLVASAPRTVIEQALEVPEGCTVEQALELSGAVTEHPALCAGAALLSVWGKKVGREHRLREGDRLEVLRPLRVDPKVARRERFVGQGARGAGLFARRRPGAKPGY